MLTKDKLPQRILLFSVALCLTVDRIQADYSADNDLSTCYSQADGTLLKIADSCNSYIYCMNEKPTTVACPAGLGFSEQAKGCILYSQSDCVDKKAETVKTAVDTLDRVTLPALFETTNATCDNEQRPENQAACVGQPFGELVPYPGDCAKFLVCMCEYPTVKDCPGGTWFDNTIKVCNFPQSVDCEYSGGAGNTTTATTPMTTTISDSEWGEDCEAPPGMSADICLNYDNGFLLRYPYNCNAYINCTMGCPVMTYCLPDKVFNAFLKICDTPDTAHCEELELPTTTTEEPTTTTEEPTTTTEEPTTTTAEPTTTTISDNEWGEDCEAPPGMSADICLNYDNGFLLRYPYNCNAYINCTMGCPVMTYCLPDKVFNAFLKICDTPDTAHCEELELPTTTTEEPTTITTPRICSPPADINADTCLDQTQGSVQSYPYNCTAYIICRWECPYVEYCVPNKVFNSVLGICDEAEDVECVDNTNPGTTTTWPTTITTPKPTLPPGVNPELCADESDYTVYPNEENCGEYLLCMNGQVEVQECPHGWLFNAELKMCDEAGEEVCYTSTATTTTEEPSTTAEQIYDLCIDQPRGVSFPYPEDCQKYYYCRGNGTYYLLNCPYNNYYEPYSGDCGPNVSPTACQVPMTTTTTTPATTTTLSPAQKCANQEFGDTLPYEENCRQYIMCTSNGGYQIMNCPGNNFYYPDSGNCGPSTDEDICRKGTATTTTSTTTTTPTTTTTRTTTTSSTTTTTSPAAPLPGICGNYTNGELIEYPDNCLKYISCVRPIPIGFYCPNNWYFDLDQQKCAPDVSGSCSELPSNVTTVAPPSGICQGQAEGDLQSYPTDCQLYYECLGDGVYMLQACPQAEYFDPMSGKCSSEVDADYCKQETPHPKPPGICWQKPDGSKIPYPNDCFKYIVCESPIPIGYACANGLQFSSEKQECVEPGESDCGVITTSTTSTTTEEPTTMTTEEPTTTTTEKPTTTTTEEPTTTTTKEPTTTTTEEPTTTTTEEPTTTTTEEPTTTTTEEPTTTTSEEPTTTTTAESTTPTICRPPAGVNGDTCLNQPEGSLQTYPYNCTAYINCRAECPYLEYCAPNKLFNSLLGICDDAVDVECIEVPYPTPGTPEPTTTWPTTIMPTLPPGVDPEMCSDDSDYTVYPYEDNCREYLLCLKGQVVVKECPNGWLFNAELKMCDEAGEEVCYTGSTTSTTTAATTTTLSPAEKCANQDFGATLPYEENCHQYIMCTSNGGYQIVNCPGNNYYYPDTGECGPSTDEDICRKGTSTTPPTTTTTSANTPAPAQGVCGSYTSGELIEYPDNCQKYISCVHPIPIAFYCPNHWYFDLDQQKCEPDAEGSCSQLPSNVTTVAPPGGICQGQEEGDHQTYPANCQLYYVCLGEGVYMMQMCPQGEYFDPLLGQCSAEVDANYCRQDFDTTTTPATTPTPKPQGICWQKPEGSKVPYPNDCYKYIVCEKPIPVGYACTNGLQFSSEREECVEPIDSDCGVITTTAAVTRPTPTMPVTECTGQPDFSLLPYEEDCAMFIVCIKNLPHFAYCNAGEYFDVGLGECSKAGNAESCLSVGTTTTATTPTTTTAVATTTTERSTTTTTATTTTVDPNAGPCDGKPDGTKFPYPNNCDKYIVCRKPIPVGYDCPEGLEFSADLNECVRPELANCSIKTTTEAATTTTTEPATTTPTTAGQLCEHLPDGTTLAYPEDCSKYYMCLNGETSLGQCMQNSYYNPSSGDCDSSSSTACRETPTTTTEITTTTEKIPGPCDDEGNGYTFSYPSDCAKYYMCLNGSPFLIKCHQNSYYNPTRGECDGTTTATACKESSTTTETSPEDSTTTTESTATTTTTTSGTTTTLAPPPPQGDNICCGQKSGTRLPYPGDTTKFVICQYPLPVVTECPADTQYDATAEECKTDMVFVDMPGCEGLDYGKALPYEGDCTKYYLCFGTKAMVMTCGNDWLFNGTLGSCVPAQLYACPW